MKLKLEIITPEKVVLSEEVDSITIPTQSGEITVLPEHENLVSNIGSGELIYKKNGKDTVLAITGGVLEINEELVTILAEHAISPQDIQVNKAKEAREKAEKLMKENLNEHDLRLAEAEQKKALLELKIAEKYRKKI
ncbi:MAG TPA: ATP synthase F1 subunit epsilon [Chlamydiales bacterium]|nr:ATP synthase F1 subunit epsilon [Chlamydiales bacterium]